MVRFSNMSIPRGRAFLSWPPVVVLLAVVAALLIGSSVRVAMRAWEFRREQQAVEEEIRKLQVQSQELSESIRALEEPEVIERLAKEKLNLKNPGEEVVLVLPETAVPPPATSSGRGWSRFLPSWLAHLFSFLRR